MKRFTLALALTACGTAPKSETTAVTATATETAAPVQMVAVTRQPETATTVVTETAVLTAAPVGTVTDAVTATAAAAETATHTATAGVTDVQTDTATETATGTLTDTATDTVTDTATDTATGTTTATATATAVTVSSLPFPHTNPAGVDYVCSVNTASGPDQGTTRTSTPDGYHMPATLAEMTALVASLGHWPCGCSMVWASTTGYVYQSGSGSAHTAATPTGASYMFCALYLLNP